MNKKWTEEQKAFIRKNAHIMKDKELAQSLGVSIDALRKIRLRLGVKKEGYRGVFKIR